MLQRLKYEGGEKGAVVVEVTPKVGNRVCSFSKLPSTATIDIDIPSPVLRSIGSPSTTSIDSRFDKLSTPTARPDSNQAL